MKIIMGLGNPGIEYENTRHNAGFMALDELARGRGAKWEFNKKFNAHLAGTADALLVKPQTYMNLSGQSANAVLSYYKLMPRTMLFAKEKNADLSGILTVVHDEMDLPLGSYRISVGSRSAGHRGVESIIQALKTKNFRRIRIGIGGRKPDRMPADKYVLRRFTDQELEQISKIIPLIFSESV